MKWVVVGLGLSLVGWAASAATFAHVSESGEVLDPQRDESANLYLQRYNLQVTKNWHVEKVPDGVQHNAAYKGNLAPGSADFLDGGKYVNPDGTDGNGVAIGE